MTTNDPGKTPADATQQGNRQSAVPGNAGQARRSDNLLPPDDAPDGRYDVAEEVSLDQQSDTARRVGQAPAGASAEAMGAALQKDSDKGAKP